MKTSPSGYVTAVRQSVLAGVCALLLAATPTLQERPAPRVPPKLVVVLVVDQMRADYLVRYGGMFSNGLARLRDHGAWFTEAAYPYLNTVTCVGHSTIGTGTFPYQHGMVLNGWVNRANGKTPGCTDDPTTQAVSYNGLPARTGDSAVNLMRPSLGEQIRKSGKGRSVGISLKPRSSIPLVGHHADAVIWFDDRGGWQTSSAFSDTPVPYLQAFITSHPFTGDQGKVWTKTLDASAYQGEDDVAAERTPAGTSRTFPHVLDGPPQKGSTESFITRWQRSPFADDYLGQLAESSIDALDLGKGSGTDFLAVSFSSLDVVGHVFGPRSHEVQDLLVRLDATIGRLLDHLDRQVGEGQYVLGLSADHGVADIPEISGTGGRQTATDIKDALEGVFSPVLGPGDHVIGSAFTDIYLTSGALKRLRVDPVLRQAAADALLALPSVSRVLYGADLGTAAARASADPAIRAAALSHYAGRSGDLIIIPKEEWLLSDNVTTHGTLYPYDQRVPVILFGSAIRPGHYAQRSSPADIAPTLAAVAGVHIAPTDGRVLSEALTKLPGGTR